MTDPKAPDLKAREPILSSEITHNGISLIGIDYLEKQGITTKENIIVLLNQLPANYADITHVNKIIFESEKYFSLQRGGQVLIVKESEIEPGDKINRRVRGMTIFNHKLQDGKYVATDGNQTIHIYSTKDWPDEKDEDVCLYTLAHETGHGTWNSIVYAPEIWQWLQDHGMINKFRILSSKLLLLITEWGKLPESNLPRYLDYKPHFLREMYRHKEAKSENEHEVSQQEDFAISHEYFMYWKNLDKQDPNRANLLSACYELMALLAKSNQFPQP